MAEPSVAPEGQVVADPAEGTTETAPGGQAPGQSVAPGQTTVSGPDAGDVELFYDPESIKGKPELELLAKQLQADYTKGKQSFKDGKDKIAQHDQFMSNPLESMKQLAQSMGWNLVQGPQDGAETQKQYKSWDDVMVEAEKRVMSKLQPMFGEMRDIKQQNVEAYLDNNHPDWRTYEDAMLKNLNEHPTFVTNPSLLYRMSVPEEVLTARANKKALKHIQDTTAGGQIQGQSTTTKQTTSEPVGPRTLQQAAEIAKKRLAEKGIHPPRFE